MRSELGGSRICSKMTIFMTNINPDEFEFECQLTGKLCHSHSKFLEHFDSGIRALRKIAKECREATEK